MSFYKLNRFHWHLSDDQGWRAEIKKWPRLTSVGSIAPNSYQWEWDKKDHIYTNQPYGPYFYTQEEMRDIVAYARRRHIEVLPEIDMPGHFVAAMTAYPEFSCTPTACTRTGFLGRFDRRTQRGQPQGRTVCQRHTGRTDGHLPYPHIHIGGDECPTVAWEQNKLCQQK